MHVLRNQSHALTLALCCLVALASIQCRRDSDRTEPDGSTVTVLFEGDERVLGPRWNDHPQHLMFLTLVWENKQGEIEGRLARRWEHSPDYRTWTFYLRRDVRWHDNVPVTAHDVKFTMELLRHPDILSPQYPSFESITVLDEFTFRITFIEPKDARLGWIVYYPKHLLENLDVKEFYRWKFWTQPVGNGPYRYVRHVPKTMIEFEANPDFYRGKPKIERLVLKLGGGTKLIELLSGNVDAVAYLKHTDIPKLVKDPCFRIYHQWHYSELVAIHWNHQHPLFRDPRVRRALTMAINRRELIQVLNYPEDTPIFDGLSYWRRAHRQYVAGKLGEPLSYNSDSAKQLLEAAGWRDQNGDGVRERAGEEAKFTMLAGGGGILSGLEPAVYIQEQLRRVGIQMDIRHVDRRVSNATFRAGEFDAAIRSLDNDPVSLLRLSWFGEGSPIGYNNPVLVKLLRKLEFTMDPETQDRVYRELWEILSTDMPVTFLFGWPETFAAHRRLQGLSSPYRSNPITYMEELWLEEDEGISD